MVVHGQGILKLVGRLVGRLVGWFTLVIARYPKCKLIFGNDDEILVKCAIVLKCWSRSIVIIEPLFDFRGLYIQGVCLCYCSAAQEATQASAEPQLMATSLVE